MRLRLATAAVALAALVLAALAAADARPDVSTVGFAEIEVSATYRGLTPGEPLEFTYTAHFADDSTYVLGGTQGRPNAQGLLTVRVSIGDLVYFRPSTPLAWVRFCLRPPGSPVLTEIAGADGHPLCSNIEGGGYTTTYDADAGTYADGAVRLNTAVAQMVAAVKQQAARRGPPHA